MQYGSIVIFSLVFVRIISFLGVSPLFTIKGIPNLLKAAFGLVLTLLIFKFVKYDPSMLPASVIGLCWTAIGECLFGLAMGFITTLVFQAIKMSGQLMDLQVGFSMANEYDPLSNSNVTLLGNLTYLTGILFFFLIDGHHILIQSLIESFKIVPVLGVSFPPEIGTYVLTLFIKTFILALKLAAPVLVVLFLTDFTLGLISRAVPQLNVLMMGLPIKSLGGLLVFAVVLPGIAKLYIKAIQQMPMDLNNFLKLFPLVILFADSNKTEEPTEKRKEDTRKKGQVARSREFTSAVTLLGATLLLAVLGDYGLQKLEKFLTHSLNSIGQTVSCEGDLTDLFTYVTRSFFSITLPVFLTMMVLGIAANLAQTGFVFSTEPLKPKFSKLNPIEGFKRMFSGRALMELLKSIANIIIIGYVAISCVKSQIYRILMISDMGISAMYAIPKDIMQQELIRVSLVVSVIGIIDFIYQKRAFKKEMMMSKEEVKEEYKQEEGDPRVKSVIRQKQREMASRRMMHEVPKATVVVTNPTHFAVALRYEQGKDSAPVCVAKGANMVAEKIKKLARDNKVPVIENKPVARMLYRKVEINETIPVELYKAVAEILAVVYSLNKKARG